MSDIGSGIRAEGLQAFPALAQMLDRLEAMARVFGLTGLLPRLDACRAGLVDGGKLDIAVLGRFKAGKSSLLNTLLARPVLPVDVLPTTAVVTRLEPGSADRAVIRFLSGEERHVALEEVPQYVTEALNPDNLKRVAIVDVELEFHGELHGVRFVDTPGLGSVFAHNSRAAREWLPRVGVAMVAINSNSPVSEDDVSLLAEVAIHTPETIIILTKADLVPSGDLDRVLGFVSQEAETRLGRRFPVLPFSTAPGFEEERREVEARLRAFVVSGDSTALRVLRHKRAVLVSDVRRYLEVGLAAAEAGERARSELWQALVAERRSLDSVLREGRTLSIERKRVVAMHSRERFLGHAVEVEAALGHRFLRASGDWRGHVGKVAHAYRDWLQAALGEELGELSHMGAEVVADDLMAAEASFGRLVRAFQDRLAGAVERALGIRFPAVEFEMEIEEPGHPDLRIDRTFDFPVETFWPLIPMAVFRRLILRTLRSRLPWEAEKNLSRLAVQWSETAWRLIDQMATQADTFMHHELAAVEELLGRPRQGTAELEAALAEVRSFEESASVVE